MSCKIVIQNFQGTYYPGNTITGHVVCSYTSRQDIRGVRIKLRGKEHTDWVERESYYDSSAKRTKYRSVHYSGNNTFLYVDLTVEGERTVSHGRQEYPFSFTLPRSLPSSFQGGYGYVKYYVKANVDIPFGFDYEDAREFTVQSPIDFNEIRNELPLNPTVYQDEKTLCCCCCASGPVTLDVSLEKEAFVLGERANVKVDVTNMSNENVECMKLKLTTTIESKTTSPRTKSKYDTELLYSDEDTGVGAHGQRTYHFRMDIPRSTVIYNFHNCTLFKQWFSFSVEAVIAGCHSNMDISTNLKLGQIPLREAGVFQSLPLQQTSSIPEAHFTPPPPYPASDKAPPYPTGPPVFPAPSASTGQIGFNLPSGDSGPVPVHGAGPYPPGPGPSSARANAPPAEDAPSAPSKAEMSAEGGFVVVDGQASTSGSSEPPPPSYSDAVDSQAAFPPGTYPPAPADQNGPSAPSK